MSLLDLKLVRSFFPALDKDWIFMDNAGGTQTAVQVADRIQDYLLNTNVQLGASYDVSVQSGARVLEAQNKWKDYINANDISEVAFGSSTTMLLQSLSRSLSYQFQAGDEIIVTNCDHEANIGPWLKLQEKGVLIKSWNLNPATYKLDLDTLDKLMTPRTQLVAFTHTSNILGTINPVKEITSFVHERGAKVCVDGVAYAPHRQVDVQDLDVDFYVFSLYKVYGPHYALLYGKQQHFEEMTGINHFFIDEVPYKIQPGNVNYELSYGLLGILDYFNKIYSSLGGPAGLSYKNQLKQVFKEISRHEEELAEKLLAYLRSKKNVTILGESSASKNLRVPTISFLVDGWISSRVTQEVDKARIGIRYGDFYARRLIETMGLLERDGVVRVSLVHYNTLDEVDRLIKTLEEIL